jgi:hypothetical protein
MRIIALADSQPKLEEIKASKICVNQNSQVLRSLTSLVGLNSFIIIFFIKITRSAEMMPTKYGSLNK